MKRAGWCCICALLNLVLVFSVGAQSTDMFKKWNKPMRPFRIAGNVHYVGVQQVSSYLITTPEGHILIDGAFAESVTYITNSIEKLGFELGDIKYLLISHAHIDHAGGVAELRTLTSAKLLCMEQEVDLLERGGLNDHSFGDENPFPPCMVDQRIGDGYQLRLGGTVLTAHLTAGHTQGSTTWTMQVEEEDRMLDVIFLSSPSFLPDTQVRDNPLYPDLIADYENTYQRLKTMPCDIFLSNHGFYFNLGRKRRLLKKGADNNPFIDPDGFRAHVDSMEAQFRKGLAEQDASGN